MKQHYLGIALFCSIMVATAIGLDYFRTPAVPTVPPPFKTAETVPVWDGPQIVGYETESAVYFADRKKLVMRVTLEWNGAGEPPRRVRVRPDLFGRWDFRNPTPLESVVVEEPFRDGRRRTIEIASRRVLGPDDVIDNYYVAFEVSDAGSGSNLTRSKDGLSSMFHVLVSYGDGRVRGLD